MLSVEIEEGTLLSTSAVSHSSGAVPPVEVAVGDDWTSISFNPPKLGIKESATEIIISWPGIIFASGGVATNWPDVELIVVTTVGIMAMSEVEFVSV